ncbi:hypothetical protein LQ564_19245 [Massilia sp. G4R7]|uniref:Uncharacterized protein n=1 Tax=Massilia phyllostachyos TaxID=2898585 RepID=A0ABS8Q9K3_9BURK|nr:hypothetical protein [Massilia phyllostachyos]MCD2518441.1 hypothetical protein [Massilia phyllostachyos]
MDHYHKIIRDAAASMLQAWREARGFFLSIEVWMMLLVAGASVGGAWLALLGSLWGLALLVFAIGYIPARAVLHARQVLSWPFV